MTTLDFIVKRLEENKSYISKKEYKHYISYRVASKSDAGYLDIGIPKPSAPDYWDRYEKAIRDIYYINYASSWEFDDFLMAVLLAKDKEEVNAWIEKQDD